MKKKLFITSLLFTVCMSFVAHAEWQQDEKGWRYRIDHANIGYYADHDQYYYGQQVIDGKKYYFGDDGYLIMGWHQSAGGYWQYSDENGVIGTTSITPDGYYLNERGWWIDPTTKEEIQTEIRSFTLALVPPSSGQSTNNNQTSMDVTGSELNQSQSAVSAVDADHALARETMGMHVDFQL